MNPIVPTSKYGAGGIARRALRGSLPNAGGAPRSFPTTTKYDLAQGPVRSWRPDFEPHNPFLVPSATRNRMSGHTMLGGSAQLPGYGYGTFKPLYPGTSKVGFARWLRPYTIPQAPNHYNQIHPRWNNSVVSGDPRNRFLVRGLTTQVPVRSHRFDNLVQGYLANAHLRTIN